MYIGSYTYIHTIFNTVYFDLKSDPNNCNHSITGVTLPQYLEFH